MLAKLFLLLLQLQHGIWAPDEELFVSQAHDNNAYDETIVKIFQSNIEETIDAITGSLDDPSVSVAEWTLGILMGVEWEPHAVHMTNLMNADRPPLTGTYFETTADATPFEIWLAEMLEYSAIRSAKRGWLFPTSFVNWVTTDPLDNVLEPIYPGTLFSRTEANEAMNLVRMESQPCRCALHCLFSMYHRIH